MSERSEERPVNCWKDTGISGDLSCPKLAEVVHCRNCTEYNRAGRQLFDREIPVGSLEEWTRILSGAKEERAEETISVIVFRIGKEWLALKTICLQEAAAMRAIHHIPLRSNNVFKGIVNVNGELLLCMSAADLLERGGEGEGENPEKEAYERMLVVKIEGERYVFPVGEILGIFRIPQSSLYEPPATMSKSPTSFVKAIFDYEERRIGLLDESRFHHSLKRSLLT